MSLAYRVIELEEQLAAQKLLAEQQKEQLAASQLVISQMRDALLWYFDLYAESNVAHLLGKQTPTEALEAYVKEAVEKEFEIVRKRWKVQGIGRELWTEELGPYSDILEEEYLYRRARKDKQ